MVQLSVVWTLLCSFCFILYGTNSFENFEYYDNVPSVVYTYNRISEIEKECRPFLSSASEMEPDDSRGHRLKNELSFSNGDWEHGNEGSPLMPFDETDIPRTSSSSIIPPMQLVDFRVTNVNPIHQLKNAVSLHGMIRIGVARNSTLVRDDYSNFYMVPGMSVLKIFFEGVYIENQENGGKRLLCMMGNTTLPTWNRLSDQKLKPQLVASNRILMVLHYPQIFSLTNRAILGEIRSLSDQESSAFFDVIYISSQLSRYSKYHFSPEEIQSRTCDESLFRDELIEDGANTFNASEFCRSLRLFSETALSIVPNWRSIGRNGDSNRTVGPFLLHSSSENTNLMIHNLICEQEGYHGKARVAAVMRAFPATMERDIAVMRTGLSGMTLSVEGTFDTSTGKLCMVGCLGAVNSDIGVCDSDVSLYFPKQISINQRSTLLGSISSNRKEHGLYIPVFFEYEIYSLDLYDRHDEYSRSYQSYRYTKVALASGLRIQQAQPCKLGTAVSQMFLTYPALDDNEDLFTSLDSLSYGLSIRAFAVPEQSYSQIKPDVYVRIEVLSLGSLFGRYRSWFHKRGSQAKDQAASSKVELLNVSLSLTFTEAPLKFTQVHYRNMSSLFLEGLYDPTTGCMYLVGCRRLTGNIGSFDTNRGLDCLVEGYIQYPSQIMKWLINPTAKIFLSSQRKEDDPLYFSPLKLKTFMIVVGDYEMDGVYRKVFEEALRALTMIISILIILSQQFYMDSNANLRPYISRAMLVILSLGYGLPLIRRSKIAFQPKEYKNPIHNLYGYDTVLDVLNYMDTLFALIAVLLFTRLGHKIRDSRKKALASLPSTSQQIPGENSINLITSVSLLVGFACVFENQWKLLQNQNTAVSGNLDIVGIGTYKIEEYMGFVQDMFLLPQVLGNMLWPTSGKPLRKLFYVGFTAMRLLLHLYDFTRDPVINPYTEAADVNLRTIFTSGVEKISIAILMTLLLIAVYFQQEEPTPKNRKYTSPKSS